MKIASYEWRGTAGVGLVAANGIVDLGRRLGVSSLRQLLDGGLIDEARRFSDETADIDLSEVALKPAVTDPRHIFCVGVNYLDHLKEVQASGIARPMPKYPSIFTRYPETLVGHDAALLMPAVSNQFDYEAELAVIIGKGGRAIDENNALDHVAGYACFNDGSVRDWQFHTAQITPGKNFLASGSFGPWVVTADEIPDPHALDVKLSLNGEMLQHGRTSDLIFGIPQIISYISTFIPLSPGDVIATGTPAGVGMSRRPQRFMKPGDVCEIQIEKIGLLRNQVVRE